MEGVSARQRAIAACDANAAGLCSEVRHGDGLGFLSGRMRLREPRLRLLEWGWDKFGVVAGVGRALGSRSF